MGKETSYCTNHPETKARRRCFQCLASICPKCQIRALGHIFCSPKCKTAFWFQDSFSQVKRYILRFSLGIKKFEREFERYSGGRLLRVISISMLLVLLYQVLALNNAVRELEATRAAPGAAMMSPTLEVKNEDGSMILAGRAEGFATVILLVDGAERDVETVRSGRFKFSMDRKESDRSVQVQVYGNDLPAIYSRAVRLPEILRRSSLRSSASASIQSGVPTAVSQGRIGMREALLSGPGDINRGDPRKMKVAITFDGGSHGNAAERILDLLAERGLTATFFLTGTFIRHYPEITRRIAREGHEVGNHTYDHPHLTTYEKNSRHQTLSGINAGKIKKELVRNNALFRKITGKDMIPMWRAPYGEHNREIREWALAAGYRHVSWTYDPKTRTSLDTLDWVTDRKSRLYLSSSQIISKIMSFDSNTEKGLGGGIILLHLGSERVDDPFYPNLASLLDQLEGKGYSVGSVSSLLGGG